MEYRALGNTGIKVSPLCLGTFNFGGGTPKADAERMIATALEAGINFIDTANYYNGGESERLLGEALQKNRSRVVLATKFHYPMPGETNVNAQGNSRRHIIQAVEGSLKRLKTDWIDLYQIHRPDFEVPQEETLRALDDLVRQGKVRYIGSSTFPAWKIMEGLSISAKRGIIRYATEQPPYNLLDRRIENELVPLCLEYNIGLLPWSPLAMGMLAGRYRDALHLPSGSRAERIGSIYADRVTPQAVRKGNELIPLAERLSLSPSQLALLWVKDQPGVTAPIIGPRTLEHLSDALAILDMNLDETTKEDLNTVYPPGSVHADFHNTSGWMHPIRTG